MADKGKTDDKPVAAEPAAKEAPVKKPSKAASYVVAAGRALTTNGRIIDAGEPITAADVADLEALVKGGFVVKV